MATLQNRFRPWLAMAVALAAHATTAGEVTAVPGPDDQGGMLMPIVSITGADNLANPTSGTISIMLNPGSAPELQSLEQWSPGDWFSTTAAWRTDIGSPTGVGGTPAPNAGNGDLFNNQYGFVFTTMSGTRATVPTGKSLAIKLTSVSSPSLQSFNYSSGSNRWDQVFASVNDQVLWNGSMWHNYFTLPASATAGTYTAQFEVFIANTPFTGATGFAQYDSAATTATADVNFAPASLTYTWNVSAVPEPATIGLMAIGSLAALPLLSRCRREGRA